VTVGRPVRITVITVLVLLVLLVIADRVLVRVATSQLSERAQRAENLPSRPSIDIRGFPFLTQVVAGRYPDVRFDVRGYTQAGPRVDDVSGSLTGVRLPLRDVIRGRVGSVPVDRVRAQVFLTFADLNAYLASQRSPVTVSADGSALHISGNVTFLGRSYPLTGSADLGVAPSAVTFTPRSFGTAGIPLTSGLGEFAARLFTVTVPVDGLPFNLHLRSATVSPKGVTVVADGTNVVLPANPPTITPAPTAGLTG
jgi:LmeA-like phospholipid-binding